jgi:RNA polymerase sigma-70 factor (ECF subfamily)
VSKEISHPTSPAQARRAFEAGRERWPDISVDGDRFVSFVGRAGVETEAYPADLYLACACDDGDQIACKIVIERYLRPIVPHLTRRGFPQDVAEEVCQTVSERLLSGPRRRIRSYAAHVDLNTWVRIISYRAAVDMVRARKLQIATEDLLWNEAMVGAVSPDPETVLMRADAGALMHAAIERAFASLTPRERTLLRHYYVSRLSIDRLAVIFHLHRATVARQIADVRERIIKRMNEYLRTVPGLDKRDRRSFDDLARSQVDLDLEELLRSTS